MLYPKVQSIYKFGSKHHICGFTEGAVALSGLLFQATEKVDGTNTRIIWDGYHISFGGRTEKAVIQPNLLKALT